MINTFKRIALLIAIICSCKSQVVSSCFILNDNMCPPWRFEYRVAAFFPSNRLFQKIYGEAMACYQLEASKLFTPSTEIFFNFDYMPKHGKSLGFKEYTSIHIFNGSVGFKFIFDIGCDQAFYWGIGPSFGGVWVTNRSVFKVRKHEDKFTVGCLAKVGYRREFCQDLFFDVFADYLYQPVRLDSFKNIGGFKTGLGIGWVY